MDEANEYNLSHLALGNNIVDEDELDEANGKIDECDKDAKWLEEVGLEEIAENYKNGQVIDNEVITKHTATLTKRQAMAVLKRVNTLNNTIRRKCSSQNTRNNGNNERELQQQQQQLQNYDRRVSSSSTGYSSSDLLTDDTSGKLSPVKLLSYRGIDLQCKSTFDEIKLIEVKVEKFDGFESFKNYNFEKTPKIGITNMNDMSENDICALRNLALLNVTALFDEYDLTFSRKKYKRKSKENGIIGVSLNNLLENDRKRNIKYRVPFVFKKMIDILRTKGLKTEGLLRVPGSTLRIKNMLLELSSMYTSELVWNKLSVNDIADLLKHFLRELPQSLLTNEYYQAFTQISYLSDIHDKLYGYMNLILLLPPVYRDTLKMLLEFLYEIIENYEYNKMNLTAVSVIMAPNLCPCSSSSKKYSVLNDADRNVTDQMVDAVKYLIKYHKLIWVISDSLIKQLRLINEQKPKKQKPVFTRIFQTFLSSGTITNSNSKRKDEINTNVNNNNNNNVNNNNNNNDHIINIKSENYPNMLSSTAGDILRSLLRNTCDVDLSTNNDLLTPKDGFYLFEQDGNIGLRRIDSNVILKDIKEENPNCNWSIRYWSFYKI